MKTKPSLALGASLIAVALVAGCTGGGATTTGGGSAGTGIKFLRGQSDEPQIDALWEDDFTKFTDETGIKVTTDVMPNDQLRTVLQTQLRSGTGPDIFGYDTGPGFAGALAKEGLIADMTSAYEENDWPIYDWAKERVTFDGKLMGVPGDVEVVGIFWNKDLFDQYNVPEPKNLADLEAAATTFKDNGVIPFAFSDQEGWQGGHILSMMLASSIGPEAEMALINGEKPWNSPEVVDVIQKFFVDYNKSGYLPPDPAAIKYDNANSLFYSGKAAMNVTGSWLVSPIEENVDFEVGLMPFPSVDDQGAFAGGLGSGTFISESSKNTDDAISYLNYSMTPEHGQWQVEKIKSIPAFPVDTSTIDASPLFRSVLDVTAEVSKDPNGFGVNIDVLTPNKFNDAMGKGLQSVLTGQMTPQQCADSMQAAFEEG